MFWETPSASPIMWQAEGVRPLCVWLGADGHSITTSEEMSREEGAFPEARTHGERERFPSYAPESPNFSSPHGVKNRPARWGPS